MGRTLNPYFQSLVSMQTARAFAYITGSVIVAPIETNKDIYGGYYVLTCAYFRVSQKIKTIDASVEGIMVRDPQFWSFLPPFLLTLIYQLSAKSLYAKGTVDTVARVLTRSLQQMIRCKVLSRRELLASLKDDLRTS